MKKQNFFKEYYIVSWLLNILFLILIILAVVTNVANLSKHEVDPFTDNYWIKQYSANTYKVKWTFDNITIGQKWMNLSSYALIEFFDEDFNLVQRNYTNESITFNKTGKFYGKITKTVNFTEHNASETRYTWLLFEIIPNNGSLSFIPNYEPQIWEEKPVIGW